MKKTKAGFSLIEAVIAVVLIAIAAVTALSFIVYCNCFALQADARITAANFARETMEGLYKRDYGDINLTAPVYPITGTDPLPAGTAFGSGFLARHTTATRTPTRTYTVAENTDYKATPVVNYKLITVTVKWN